MWSKKHKINQCIKCDKNKFKHLSHGFCRSCYFKERYKNNPQLRQRTKENTYQWIKKHPEKFKEMVNLSSVRRYFKFRYGDKWKEKMIEKSKYGNKI